VALALDRLSGAGALGHWTVQPLALALVAALAIAYGRELMLLRREGGWWPAGRTVTFTAGLLLLVFASCGFPQVYADDLYWVWTAQTLVLWILVPIVILAGHPVQLATRGGRGRHLQRALRLPPLRVLASPLVGPALVPLLSAVLFFGPLPRWAIEHPITGWVLQLVLLAVGALMVLPLVGLEEQASSLAVGLSLLIGSVELVLDAVPGVVLRLHNTLATSWFDARAVHGWSPSPISDQRVAGAVLWCVAEVIDLPFLVLVFRRWVRADAREAAEVDAVLEAERAAHGTDRDTPWWLTGPEPRDRPGRPD
jgi:cytochrome c oxidase assembly factor CtaG